MALVGTKIYFSLTQGLIKRSHPHYPWSKNQDRTFLPFFFFSFSFLSLYLYFLHLTTSLNMSIEMKKKCFIFQEKLFPLEDTTQIYASVFLGR